MRYWIGVATLCGPAIAYGAAQHAVQSAEYAGGQSAYKAAERAKGPEEERLKAEALTLFEQACGKNDPRACSKIATEGYLTSAYGSEEGRKRTEAATKAAEIYDYECNAHSQGYVTTLKNCAELAHLVRSVRNADGFRSASTRTNGLPAYVGKAANTFLEICSTDPEAFEMDCMGASQLLATADPKRAKQLDNELCESSITWACHNVGRMSSQEKAVIEKAEATCIKKDGAACFQVAVFWHTALTKLPDSNDQTAKWLQQGCNENHADSCGTLGGFLATGKLGKKDYPAALTYMEKACNLAGSGSSSPHCRNAEKVRAALAK